MLETTNTVLVVVDFQGKLAQIVHESASVVKNAATLIQGMKVLNVPVLATEQYPKGLGHTVEELAVHLTSVPLFEKDTFSCTGSAEFNTALAGLHRSNVILCGIETHVCVYQTAKDLLKQGHKVHLVTDAVSSRTTENKQLGISKISALGAQMTGTEMVLFELLKVSGTDQFKAISKLVR